MKAPWPWKPLSRDFSMALPSRWQELPRSILVLWDRYVPAALKTLVGARLMCSGALSTHHASCAHHGTSPWAFLRSLLILDAAAAERIPLKSAVKPAWGTEAGCMN